MGGNPKNSELQIPPGLSRVQAGYEIKNPERFCTDRQELQRCMLNARTEWHLPESVIMTAIKNIRTLNVEGLKDDTRIIAFLRRAIPIKVSPELFYLLANSIIAPIMAAKRSGTSVEKVADDFAKYFVKVIQKQYADNPALSAYSLVMRVIGDKRLDERPNDLSSQNIEVARRKLRKGDIVLVADHRTLSGATVGGALTHSMLYIGNGLFIHSVPNRGIVTDDLSYIFREYDAMAIVRPKMRLSTKQIDTVIARAMSHHGKHYDMYMLDDDEKLYCTELVEKAYASIGLSVRKPGDNGNKHKTEIARKASLHSVHPMVLLNRGTKVVWRSDNLTKPDADGNGMEFVLGGVKRRPGYIASAKTTQSD